MDGHANATNKQDKKMIIMITLKKDVKVRLGL